jgi:hypothetical protein
VLAPNQPVFVIVGAGEGWKRGVVDSFARRTLVAGLDSGAIATVERFGELEGKPFLPIPSSPVNRREPGMRPPVSRRLSDSFTSSLPIRVENIEPSGFGLRFLVFGLGLRFQILVLVRVEYE